MSIVSAAAIFQAAASQQAVPVGEDMQQRQYFCSDKGFQAQDIAKAGAPCLSQAAKEDGLAVQVKVIQAGAAVWLPAQQGRDWPVNVMLEVSLFSARALPEGVDVKIVADAVTDAQKVVLSHRGPLPLRLQRLLAPGAKPTGVRGGTMFAAPQDRRLAHVAVPEGGSWIREHFIFPVLSFQKHSGMQPLSLMFCVTATPGGRGGAETTPDVAATVLRPRTISVQNLDEAHAALKVLNLRANVRGRSISIQRGGRPDAAPAGGAAHRRLTAAPVAAAAPRGCTPAAPDVAPPGDLEASPSAPSLSACMASLHGLATAPRGRCGGPPRIAGVAAQPPRELSPSSHVSRETLEFCAEGTRRQHASADLDCSSKRVREEAWPGAVAEEPPNKLPSLETCVYMLAELLGGKLV